MLPLPLSSFSPRYGWCPHRGPGGGWQYFGSLSRPYTVAKPFQNAREGCFWAAPVPVFLPGHLGLRSYRLCRCGSRVTRAPCRHRFEVIVRRTNLTSTLKKEASGGEVSPSVFFNGLRPIPFGGAKLKDQRADLYSRIAPDKSALVIWLRSAPVSFATPRSASSMNLLVYWVTSPPSTTMLCPVTNDAESEQSQITASAISSGVPIRPTGSIPIASSSV